MLAAKRLPGIALKGNRRNPSYTGDETCKKGDPSGFETQVRRHQKSGGTSGATERCDVFQFFFGKIAYFDQLV